ncbi:hypothetical protein LZ31DRAFT_363552 [Colletotrichum somersetense]|nr:hypothetical protein LZ31DRAFT_363552 [Colletotrichum somersetense]
MMGRPGTPALTSLCRSADARHGCPCEVCKPSKWTAKRRRSMSVWPHWTGHSPVTGFLRTRPRPSLCLKPTKNTGETDDGIREPLTRNEGRMLTWSNESIGQVSVPACGFLLAMADTLAGMKRRRGKRSRK